MDEQVVKVLLAGPLYALAAVQVFGPHRLWSRDSLKIFLWGMLFAIVSLPFWSLVGVAKVAAGPEPYFEMGARMVRIWLIFFTLAAVGRLGVMIVKYVWRRRPRPQPIRPPEPARPEPLTPSPAERDHGGLPH